MLVPDRPWAGLRLGSNAALPAFEERLLRPGPAADAHCDYSVAQFLAKHLAGNRADEAEPVMPNGWPMRDRAAVGVQASPCRMPSLSRQ